jgi:hypothetical protein
MIRLKFASLEESRRQIGLNFQAAKQFSSKADGAVMHP